MKKISLRSKAEAPSKIGSLRKQLIKKPTTQDILKYVDSGCCNLNLALTGQIDKAYPIGRIINVYGGESTAKTLIACEAINSLYYIEGKKKGKKVKALYDDSENAFDYELAEKFGMPLDEIEFFKKTGPSKTVEEMHIKLWKAIEKYKDYDAVLFIEDSLDALSDEDEKKKIQKMVKDGTLDGDYGAKKAKLLSSMFRDLAGEIKNTNLIFFTISQVRDNVGGGMYAPKTKVSGGRAWRFYCSQILELKNKEEIKEGTIVQGMKIDVKVKKNKIWKPRREINFNLYFEYGIDNIGSLIDFISKHDKKFKIRGGNYLWNGKEFECDDLIKHIEQNPKEFKQLKDMGQNTWDKIEAKADIQREPKWKWVEENE